MGDSAGIANAHGVRRETGTREASGNQTLARPGTDARSRFAIWSVRRQAQSIFTRPESKEAEGSRARNRFRRDEYLLDWPAANRGQTNSSGARNFRQRRRSTKAADERRIERQIEWPPAPRR